MLPILFIILVSLINLLGVNSNVADFDCFERSDNGPGRAYFEVYAWNVRNKTCNKFIYGGLLGNRNRFQTSEECYQSCHDAILNKQLTFQPSRRYHAVNQHFEAVQISFYIEPVDDDYFKLITQPANGLVLSAIMSNDTSIIIEQESNGSYTQHWDIIPAGEKSFYRIKTRSKVFHKMDYLFLQVNDRKQITSARRDDSSYGQQWRLV